MGLIYAFECKRSWSRQEKVKTHWEGTLYEAALLSFNRERYHKATFGLRSHSLASQHEIPYTCWNQTLRRLALGTKFQRLYAAPRASVVKPRLQCQPQTLLVKRLTNLLNERGKTFANNFDASRSPSWRAPGVPPTRRTTHRPSPTNTLTRASNETRHTAASCVYPFYRKGVGTPTI